MEDTKVLNTNPTKFIIAGILTILFFFGGLAAWSVYFPFQGAVIAPGTVEVSGNKKVIQHLEGGIIDKILVKDGDHVKKNDLLIRLKSSQVDANVDLLQGRLRAKQAESARLSAEMGMKDKIKWPGILTQDTQKKPEVNQLMVKEQDIFNYRRSDLKVKISLYSSQIEQLKERIQGAKEEMSAQMEVMSNLAEELGAKRSLLKDNYMGKSAILELERALAEGKGRKGKLKQDIAEYRQKIEEFKLRIVDIKNQYRETAVSKLGEVKDAIFELQEQIKPKLDTQRRLEVRAPMDGIVIGLNVNSEESGVIRSGMPLMEIVPALSSLVVSAQVIPQDITRVKIGQDTKVALSAFERGQVPPVPGKVVYVSPDLITDPSGRTQRSYYEAHVEVKKDALASHNAYLSPGMPVVCYITTDTRSVISYLVDPLLENVDRAFRE